MESPFRYTATQRCECVRVDFTGAQLDAALPGERCENLRSMIGSSQRRGLKQTRWPVDASREVRIPFIEDQASPTLFQL